MNHKRYSFSKYPLYANETPVFRQQPNSVFIPYGKQNDYPDYLAYLFNNSGIHAAIVKGKSAYIFGKGLKIKDDWKGNKVKLQQTLDSINSFQTADELIKKEIFEGTLYGGCAYLIEWDAFGKIAAIKQTPFNTIRTNEFRTEFYVSKEWTREMSVKTKWKKSNGKLPEDTKTYPAFNPLKPKGKQILYLTDENPASDIYPLPEYVAGNTPIETDIECNFFQLNNVKTGFAAGTMVTFFNGTAENDEEQREIEHAFKQKTSGTDNAGEILLNFQNPNTQAPEIKPLRSNELDKQYEQLSKDTINKILYSHRVSNGLLFGIKTPGELGGGRSEFDLAWEHFSNTYVQPKQKEHEDNFNYLLSFMGYPGNPIELVVLDPIGLEITAADVMAVLNLSEKRKLILEKYGIEPIEEVAPAAPEMMSAHKDYIIDKFMQIGVNADDYEVVSECFEMSEADNFAEDSEQKVTDYLKKNKKVSIKDLAKKLEISEKEVYKILDRLNKSNTLIVNYVEKNGEVVIETEAIQDPKAVALESKWRYTTRLEPKLLDTSREFCVKMVGANKLYTRAEIDQLQNEAHTRGFNEDVWKYKGGCMTVKGTNIHVPQCRHYWQSVIVKKK
jgi:hypothetical protein